MINIFVKYLRSKVVDNYNICKNFYYVYLVCN